jgi:uncharacterized membrane protein YqiK
MLSEIKEFVKAHFADIMLFIIIVLLVMLAFGAGFITAKYQTKEPVQILNTKQ